MSHLTLRIGNVYRSSSGSLVTILKRLNLPKSPYLGSNHKLYTEKGYGLTELNRHNVYEEPDNLIEDYDPTFKNISFPEVMKRIDDLYTFAQQNGVSLVVRVN